MVAIELRLGNLVYATDKDRINNIITEVCDIDYNGINRHEGSNYYIGNFTTNIFHEKVFIIGIPITEEWLIKFGFEKDKDVLGKELGWYSLKMEPKFSGINDDLTYHIEDARINIGYDYNVEIKYVHSLQNLFFSITGKELEIKPTT